MSTVAVVQELLGGPKVTGPLKTELDVIRMIKRGLAPEAVSCFMAATELKTADISHHVIPLRTLSRRLQKHQALDPAEADRLVRLARLIALTRETFGDVDTAARWLHRENKALDGATPLSIADTDQGVRSVEALLGRIGHGIAA